MSRQGVKKGLSVKIHDIAEDSFIADGMHICIQILLSNTILNNDHILTCAIIIGDIFIKDNLAINASGIAMRNNPKTFNLEYEELEFGETIGRGCSSVVLHGIHAPTGTQLALKVINMFDKNKRDQLIREIRTLYDAQCSRCSSVMTGRRTVPLLLCSRVDWSLTLPSLLVLVCAQPDHLLRLLLPGQLHHDRPGVHGRRLAGERGEPGGRRARARAGKHCVPDPVGAGLPLPREARAPRHQALQLAHQLLRRSEGGHSFLLILLLLNVSFSAFLCDVSWCSSTLFVTTPAGD